MLIVKKRFVLELDAVGESKVEHRNDHEVVLLHITHRRPRQIRRLLVRPRKFLINPVDEPRRGEGVVFPDRGELATGETAEVLVVVSLDVVAEEEDGLAAKPREREGGRRGGVERRKREDEGSFGAV